MDALKPCPFCGFASTDPPHPRLRECRDNAADPSFWIECDNCLCNGPMAGRGSDSRAQWSSRAMPPEVRAVVEEMKRNAALLDKNGGPIRVDLAEAVETLERRIAALEAAFTEAK